MKIPGHYDMMQLMAKKMKDLEDEVPGEFEAPS
jgi:hypothetical protein